MSTQKTSIIDSVKLWIFPTLVSILSMMIWMEVRDLKQDVKQLLAQSNIDKTKIEMLERQVYGKRLASNSVPLTPPTELPKDPRKILYVEDNRKKFKTQKIQVFTTQI